ncbi:sarcoplasmic calcium-binding protein-like [Lingula anatina]|uniref:Sarcoplasmic calcium-binding protein-like n=1 Tax=Lingula anatina TaxID=7574 RepID=A0A1S3H6Q8_LINAN|nr:sarcoplasmic calcium-binding protein-like [Lingula anatina]|eukprot:XP_013380814.1 sarcoplasmic calcium-binding protein-like [Lingula anatina]
MDIDGDGFISPKEHEAVFFGWGIPIKHSSDVFKVLDADGDGLISKEEFIEGATPHDYPMVKGSEIWKRKFRTLFRSNDVDGDGYLTRRDFELSAHRVTAYMCLDENEAKKVLKNRLDIWEEMTRDIGKPDGSRVSEDEYISNFLQTVNTSYRDSAVSFASTDFDSIDLDGDGFISPKEHEAFFYSWGIPTERSADVFKTLDRNGDGLISKEEFIQGAMDFSFTEDENNPYNNFLGPLAN